MDDGAIVHHIGQAVGREQDAIAVLQIKHSHVGCVVTFVSPKMLGQYVPPLMPQSLFGRDSSGLNQRLSQTYRIIAGWFEAAGIELRPIMELGNTEAIKTLVAAGVGVGILPVERKQGILVYGSTQVRPLKPVLMRALAIVKRREKSLGMALKIVYDALLTLSKP